MILSFKIISWVVFDVVALCSDDASWSHWHSMLHVQEHGAFESRFSRPILKSVDLAPSHISALFFCDTVKKSISQLICCEKEASEFCGSIWGKDEKMQFFEPRGQKRKASAKDLAVREDKLQTIKFWGKVVAAALKHPNQYRFCMVPSKNIWNCLRFGLSVKILA